MFVLIMTLCYSANLAAFLTTSSFVDTIDSLEDVLNQNDLRFGVFDYQYSLIHDLLKVKDKTSFMSTNVKLRKLLRFDLHLTT